MPTYYNSYQISVPQATPRGSAKCGGEGCRQKREGLSRSGEWELSRPPIESVDFLCAGAPYKGQDISGKYRFTDTWVKRNGKWQAVASQYTKVQQ